MRCKSCFCAVFSFMVLIALSPSVLFAAPSFSYLPENPVGGSSVFVTKNCLHCHAIQGYGGSGGPDLGRLKLKGGFLAMAGFMWNHAPKMIEALSRDKIPFPRFNTEEMTQLVSFLYALNYLDRPGDARRGEEVFTAKRCVSCHSVGGKGESVGPPLDKFRNFVSPIFVATVLWNKGPTMAAAMRKAGIERPVLSGADVRDVVAFIRSQSNRSADESSHVFVRPGNPKAGASLFESKGCSGCHSLYIVGEGEEKEIPWLGGPPLVGQELKTSLSDIASRLWNHSPGMWALWKKRNLPAITFTVNEMADVTAYLYFLQFTSPPGDPARGVHLYIRHGCASCHTSSQAQESVGPDLRTRGPWVTDIELATEMWNHAGNMYGTLPVVSKQWPMLREREVADLLAYVRSIGGTRKKEKKKD